MARILIVTPASAGSRAGNRVTANRWARLLRALGHRVQLSVQYSGQRCDVLIALHAKKSAASILAFSRQSPDRPLVLTMTGTDLYQDLRSSAAARRSVETASRLVVLQPHAINELPANVHKKTRVIFQSAKPLRTKPRQLTSVFEVCVSGHLRAVKDPFRAAEASRLLPSTSRIRVTHVGAALSQSFERQAIAEMQRNPRYVWLGEVPQWRARQVLGRSRLLALTSKLEGGANVISEALVSDVPVVSSNISGSIGLLGESYPGFFETGNTQQLADLLYRCEQDGNFLSQLHTHCRQLAPRFTAAQEQEGWRALLAEFRLSGQ